MPRCATDEPGWPGHGEATGPPGVPPRTGSAGRLDAPPVAVDGLDVIEGNEGGPRPLICEA